MSIVWMRVSLEVPWVSASGAYLYPIQSMVVSELDKSYSKLCLLAPISPICLRWGTAVCLKSLIILNLALIRIRVREGLPDRRPRTEARFKSSVPGK